ncbi:hypothetical protein RyT2_24200 [Pseudolactococcus yaeyamensis]
MANLSKYLDPENSQKTHIPLETRRKQQVQVPKKQNKLTTVKVTLESYEKLNILKTATGQTHLSLLDAALELYFETIALENQKVKAYKALADDYKVVDGQMTIDDF